MSNIKSNLVFDFPDPSPRFEFDDAPKKSKLKSTKGFGKFKSSKVKKQETKVGSFTKNPSPDKSTATTASASSFDESAFDDFDDDVFDFGVGKNGKQKHSSNSGSARTSPQQSSSNDHAAVMNVRSASPFAAESSGSYNSNEFSAAPAFKTSFEFADAPSSSHRPLKLPNTRSTALHQRSPSVHSNSGYISEVSEFSFDRVTVNTIETPMTGLSSNISWNFFDADHGKDASQLGYVPYTGEPRKKAGVDIRSLLEDSNAAPAAPTAPNSNQIHSHQPRHQFKINMDDISLSDRSDELPISGIVSSSNQSIISEISDANMDNNEELNDAVKSYLKSSDEKPANATSRRTKTSTPPPPQKPIPNTTPTSLNYSEDPTSKDPQSSTMKNFEMYKAQRMEVSRMKSGDSNNNTSSKNETNVFSSIIDSVRTGLDFCTWYLCGTDTTQPKTENQMSKEDRQREMDDRFLNKFVYCSCNDLGCGMSNML